jgi:hypothetical protein
VAMMTCLAKGELPSNANTIKILETTRQSLEMQERTGESHMSLYLQGVSANESQGIQVGRRPPRDHPRA